MTTNIDRAAEVIDRHMDDADAYPLTMDHRTIESVATMAAQALADAGLLMPDLPEPDEGEWEEGRSVISVDDEGFVLPSIDSRPTHPGRARRIAYALLAAADYAEQEQGNEA